MIDGSTLVDETLVEVLVSWISQDGWNLEVICYSLNYCCFLNIFYLNADLCERAILALFLPSLHMLTISLTTC